MHTRPDTVHAYNHSVHSKLQQFDSTPLHAPLVDLLHSSWCPSSERTRMGFWPSGRGRGSGGPGLLGPLVWARGIFSGPFWHSFSTSVFCLSIAVQRVLLVRERASESLVPYLHPLIVPFRSIVCVWSWSNHVRFFSCLYSESGWDQRYARFLQSKKSKT